MSQRKQFKFLPWTAPIFEDQTKTYWIISGGRASGKSTNIAAYFLMRLLSPEYFRGVVSRYTQKSISSSIYRDILDLIADWGVGDYIEIKGEDIKARGSKNMISTHAMRLQENTVTAKGKGLARVTHLLIDEATELPSENEYQKLIDSFRVKGSERKIFLLFNPTTKAHWIYKRFYEPDGTPNMNWAQNHGWIHTTYQDNMENIDPLKCQEWELMKGINPEYYDHHILGKWLDIGSGNVYKNWSFSNWEPDEDAEVLYGIDFGFAHDPAAVIKVLKRGQRLWLEEISYSSGLTNRDLSQLLLQKGVPSNATIFADAAEPKSIEELKQLGFRNIKPCVKGADSIRSGIQKVRDHQVYVHPHSKNLKDEYMAYVYREGTDTPVDKDNHLMDALRYAISTYSNRPKFGIPNIGRYKPQNQDED